MPKETEEMTKRLRRSLYSYSNRPSFQMTNLAVQYYSQSVSPGLGQVNMDFAAVLTRKSRVSPCTLMLALVYVDRLRSYNPEYLHKISSSDLFLVSMIVASKFLNDAEEDEIYNDQWAESASMDTRDVNKLERQFLAALDWQVFVDVKTLWALVNRTEYILALGEGKVNGWFSYTDLEILTRQLRTAEILSLIVDRIFKVTAVCAVTYAAGIFTLIASTCAVSELMGPVLSLSSFSRNPSGLSHPLNGTQENKKNCVPGISPHFPISDYDINKFEDKQFNSTDYNQTDLVTWINAPNSIPNEAPILAGQNWTFDNWCDRVFETHWTPNFGTKLISR